MNHSILKRALFILLAIAANTGAPGITSTDASASSHGGNNLLWLLVIAGALYFALAAAPERGHAR